MNKFLLIFLGISLIFLFSVLLYIYRFHDDVVVDRSIKKEKVPNDWLYRQRAYPVGSIDVKAYFNALAYRKEISKNLSHNNRNLAKWEFCGPTNIGGRVSDIEMNNTSPPVIFVGTASGGIFKSTDEGTTWIPIFDDESSLSIGDLALAPSDNNIIYAGTGEANAGGGSIAYDGNGIYRSDNGGDTWRHLGLENIGSVGKIIVDPRNADKCFVGAMGNLFESNQDRGLFRTSDGGITWDKVLYINDSTGVIDVAIHPKNPDTIFAATWERVRRVHRRSYGGPSSGIYKTTNGGETWQELTNGLPEKSGRIGIAISASHPEILYAIYIHEISGYIKGLYKSSDNGNTWTQMNHDGIYEQPYMWWFGKIFIDPNNPDVVYLTSYHMEKSVDGGNTWNTIFTGAHVDQHAVYINPENSEMVLIGNDGGVYRSNNGGTSKTKLNGLPNVQFYTCEIDFSTPERIYGGAQDNGTLRTFSGDVSDWDEIYFGDGFRVLVDPSENIFVYAEYQYGALARSTNGGSIFIPATNGISSADRHNWNTPVIFNPINPAILYYGTNRLYKSNNRAVNWTVISPDLTKHSIQTDIIFGTITAISVSPLNDDIIYVGTDDGNVQVTTNDGNSWSLVSDSLPDRWVTSLAADPTEMNSAYVTFSGFRFGENIGHIYRTEDLGKVWEDISGDLPDIPVNDLVISPLNGWLFIATDIGVFYSVNKGIHWNLLSNGLPNVVCTDLSFHSPTNTLVAASYGRGMFKINLDDLPTAVDNVDPNVRTSLMIYPNPSFGKASVKVNVSIGMSYTIGIYNMAGTIIKIIHDAHLPEGSHEFHFDLSQYPDGLYICTIKANEGILHRSHKLIKL